MSLTKNFEIINKILYVFHSFKQRQQSNNTTTAFVINNKIDENLNIMIKKFKCYNCDKTDHKTFAYLNKHVLDKTF